MSKRGYNHRRCNACDHGFLYPVPDQASINEYYQQLNTGLSSDASWETDAGHKNLLWKKLLNQVERISGRGPILDLGCGGGQFLKLAADIGWTEAEGVEPSPKAVAIARSLVAAPIHEGAWNEITLPASSYAAIALMDVLEHDTDPAGLLAHAFSLLRPGGSILLSVPNVYGLSLRTFGADAFVVIPPEHISYFTARSLRHILRDAGFVSPWTFTCDLYLKEWIRLFNRIAAKAPAETPQPARSQYLKWHHRLSGGLARRGIAAANVVLAMAGCGDQLVAVAQKPLRSSENV